MLRRLHRGIVCDHDMLMLPGNMNEEIGIYVGLLFESICRSSPVTANSARKNLSVWDFFASSDRPMEG